MSSNFPKAKRGFTLLETVIAIGVLAVLLTGFIIVFAPAAAGIKKSINVQEADRLASTVEQELVTMRAGEKTFTSFDEPAAFKTGFEKAFYLVRNSNSKKANPDKVALLVYQYRGSMSSLRPDGSPTPVKGATQGRSGVDYVVRSMVRRRDDAEFIKDLEAVEGSVYAVKCTQLVFDLQKGELKAGTAGQILDPKGVVAGNLDADTYPEAVIAFAAEFYSVPAKSAGYFDSRFSDFFSKAKNPVFTRNLAVRR